MTVQSASSAGKSGAGFLPFYEPKGDEKSFAGNPAGSTSLFATGEFAARSESSFTSSIPSLGETIPHA